MAPSPGLQWAGDGVCSPRPKSNFTPAYAQLHGDIADLGTLHEQGHWLPALKAACALVGLGNGLPSPPLDPAIGEQRRAVRTILERHGLLGNETAASHPKAFP